MWTGDGKGGRAEEEFRSRLRLRDFMGRSNAGATTWEKGVLQQRREQEDPWEPRHYIRNKKPAGLTIHRLGANYDMNGSLFHPMKWTQSKSAEDPLGCRATTSASKTWPSH